MEPFTTFTRVRVENRGDALMPLLFSLGQHAALEAVTTTPERVGIVHNILEQELHRHARIHIHVGKTQVWNAA